MNKNFLNLLETSNVEVENIRAEISALHDNAFDEIFENVSLTPATKNAIRLLECKLNDELYHNALLLAKFIASL